MTREEFIQQAFLKMLPPVFKDTAQLSSTQVRYRMESIVGYENIIINEAMRLSYEVEEYYWQRCNKDFFDD